MKKLLMTLLVLACVQAGAQDMTHFKRIVKQLSSAKYQGRGYARNGANKAGKFLQKEFEKAGVDEVTIQPFKLDINDAIQPPHPLSPPSPPALNLSQHQGLFQQVSSSHQVATALKLWLHHQSFQ